MANTSGQLTSGQGEILKKQIVRGQWKSRLGFILAASGSAIGLGNIVFFSANAYRFGGGAFYLPYLLGLFLIGIPVMIVEFGLGEFSGRAFPAALHRVAGRKGEFIGWFGLINAGWLTMYYVAILGWVVGMLFGSFGALWHASPVPAFNLPEGAVPDAVAYFFGMLSTWNPLIYLALVWVANAIIVRRGVESIEPVTKLFVPLMWLFMLVLIVRGVTLPNGMQGVYLLFTPKFSVMKDPAVWQGAFSQIFFTLSLGFGVMTAYASYLPKKSDLTQNSVITSLLNCGFEYIAGLAVFAILFAFAIVPNASTLSMTFFIIPRGISELPAGVALFGVIFFILLLLAGLTSSVSLVEGIISAMRDKYQWHRGKTVAIATVIGIAGSACFSLPQVVNPGLENDGTLGLTLLDLIDHWVFSYGLLIMGLCQCILVGWVLGPDKIRALLNPNSKIKLGSWFDVLVKYIIPLVLAYIIGYGIYNEFAGGLYGTSYAENYSESFRWLRGAPVAVLLLWVGSGILLSLILTRKGDYLHDAK